MTSPAAFKRLGPAAREICVNSAPQDSRTDQTAQTDQHVEKHGTSRASPGLKLTTPHLKLTGGPARGGLSACSVP
jgi:hypothetical protein